MGTLSLGHWIILGFILMLFLGPFRMQNLGRIVGRAVRGFKEGLHEIDAESRPVDEISEPSSTSEKESVSKGGVHQDIPERDRNSRDRKG